MSRSSKKSNAPRLDAANLAGITTLMNPQHVKMGMNLQDAEKSIMRKHPTTVKKSENDPVKLYTAELNQLAEDLGIDLLDDTAAVTAAPVIAAPEQRPSTAFGRSQPSSVTKLIDKVSFDSASSTSGDSSGASASGSASASSAGSGSEDEECDCDSECESECSCGCHCDCDSECESECSCECHDDGSDGSSDVSSEADKVDNIISRLEDDLGIKTDSSRDKNRHKVHGSSVSIPTSSRRSTSAATDEQERRRHINSVVADIRGETRTTFGVERERVLDIKASKLEQIGQLRMTLEEEGIDCGSVSNPTTESPVEEIDSVLNILRLKNDRNRYSSLAEEVILGVAEGIETVFDGTRSVPLVGWRPDYTGYHNTVNVKLHRMRFETSQVVGNIIEKYNIGPTARIIMELLPSFFLYPRQQKKQRGTPGLSSDPHVSDARSAYSAIRGADERKALQDL